MTSSSGASARLSSWKGRDIIPSPSACPFRSASAAPQFALLEGWSAPEPGTVWSDDSAATLGLTLPPARPPGTALQVSATFNLDPTGHQRVQVELNGRPAATWDVSVRSADLRLPLPADAVPPSGAAVITFRIAAPHSPGGKDGRQLGIALHSVTLAGGSGPGSSSMAGPGTATATPR